MPGYLDVDDSMRVGMNGTVNRARQSVERNTDHMPSLPGLDLDLVVALATAAATLEVDGPL